MPLESSLETSAAVAVRAAGGQTVLARKLGIAQSTVATWLRRGTELPAHFVIPVEKAFGVSRHDLRPDLYPPEERADHLPAAPHPPIPSSDAQQTAAHPSAPASSPPRHEAGVDGPTSVPAGNDPLKGLAA